MSFPKRLSIEKFSASDGVLLYGLLAMPEHSRKKTAVLHVHGLGGSFYGSSAVEELAQGFESKVIAFFSIQTRGSNAIEKFDRMKHGKRADFFFAGSALERFEDCVYDIEGAMRFLASKGYRSIVLEGHSTGCQKILYYHSKSRSRRVKALVLLSPGDDYNSWKVSLGKRFDTAVSEAKRTAKMDRDAMMPSRYIPPWMKMSVSRFLSTTDPRRPESRILDYAADRMGYIAGIRVPALAVIGDEDMYMDAAGLPARKAAETLRRNSNRIEAVVIRGADHSFHGKRRKLVNTVVKWVQKTL